MNAGEYGKFLEAIMDREVIDDKMNGTFVRVVFNSYEFIPEEVLAKLTCCGNCKLWNKDCKASKQRSGMCPEWELNEN